MRRAGERVFDFWWGEGIADDVPALAYYLMLSLAPFALGVAVLQALLLKDVLSAISVANQINRFLPEAVHDDIRQLVIGTRDNSPALLGLSVAAMLWTSSGAIGVIERCESRMLGCPRHDVVTGRIRNLGLGALVALAFVISAGSAPVIGEATAWFDLRGALPGGLIVALNGAGSVALFTVIYRYAPRSRLRWRTSLLGAVPAGLAIQAIPALVGLYFGAAAGLAVVRLFLLLAVLLAGVYAMATVMLLGAGLAVRGEGRRRRRRGEIEEREAAPGAPEGMLSHKDREDDPEPRVERVLSP